MKNRLVKAFSNQIFRYVYAVKCSGVSDDISYLKPKELSEKISEDLFLYTENIYFEFYRDCVAGIALPGMYSHKNKKIDAVESILRMLPFWAVVAVSNTMDSTVNKRAKAILKDFFSRENLVLKWGRGEDYSQYLVDSADLALTLWILRGELEDYISGEVLPDILNWLVNNASCEYYENNWLLFRMTKLEVLKALGVLGDEFNGVLAKDFLKIKSWVNQYGWFRDGHKGEVDFYTVWGFYYTLFWLYKINPDEYGGFLKENFQKFYSGYKLLLSQKEFPFWGRSACYKYAISIPYYIACDLGLENRDFASKMNKQLWDRFWKYEVYSNSVLLQGFMSESPEYYDNYSGPGSPLWSLRSLVLDVVVDSGGYDVEDIPISANISDNAFLVRDDCNSRVFLSEKRSSVEVLKYSFFDRFLEVFTQRANRPGNKLRINCE
ncbi:DUF2264 domain-containing protein [Oceanobacter mangrovi]|uniref:DUF2264 domain-containing protein n=1 Tax=Oceanobacter mangrovi TaxID=2862510 RepID=UPI001C8DF531|nr:DUF2264 domain-containing protein [Oceanobacter mangrovi]